MNFMSDEKKTNKTNKERLTSLELGQVGIDIKLDCILNKFDNHLEHHKKLYDRVFKICLAAAMAVITAGLTVGGAILTAWILKG
jgi:hypothetical protein